MDNEWRKWLTLPLHIWTSRSIEDKHSSAGLLQFGSEASFALLEICVLDSDHYLSNVAKGVFVRMISLML